MTREEDVYAARIGRNMWRLAKRRAREAAMRSAALIGLPAARGAAGSGSKSLQPPPPPDQDDGPEAEGPRTLSEFLRELAEELERDEPDPDES